ncbi:hypothetical protein, partial [Xanthomonas perforans]|uniref:hypothetical protein n=1 Tax=Xanthomonas perforans TaxID=442694 RepID=UPI0019D2C338
LSVQCADALLQAKSRCSGPPSAHAWQACMVAVQALPSMRYLAIEYALVSASPIRGDVSRRKG